MVAKYPFFRVGSNESGAFYWYRGCAVYAIGSQTADDKHADYRAAVAAIDANPLLAFVGVSGGQVVNKFVADQMRPLPIEPEERRPALDFFALWGKYPGRAAGLAEWLEACGVRLSDANWIKLGKAVAAAYRTAYTVDPPKSQRGEHNVCVYGTADINQILAAYRALA